LPAPPICGRMGSCCHVNSAPACRGRGFLSACYFVNESVCCASSRHRRAISR
jgi:hypothetical protein